MLALFFYRLLFLLLTPLLLLALLLRSRSQKAYRQRLAERFGLAKLTPTDIIIHAASVGEVLALKQLVQNLIEQQPTLKITFTTFTPTGSEQVSKLFDEQVQHCYLPLDVWPCTWLFLKKLKPKAIVFMETELWPNLVAQAKNNHCKLLLINGRLSVKSTPKYQKLRALIKPCLTRFDNILCQSEDNRTRFLSLGTNTATTSTSGNLKYDIAITETIIGKQNELSTYLPEKNRPVWLVASTHPGDDELILSSFKTLLTEFPNLLLILVPRHPERFEQVATLASHEFKLVKRSSQQQVSSNDNIWLLDSLGELMAVFGLADIVTMGGSFSHVGGHNPLEPALFKKPVITGPNMSNFTEIQQQLLAANAVIELNDSDDLAEQLSQQVAKLIKDPKLAETIGANAEQVVLANQGAVNKTIEVIAKLLK